MRKNTRLKVATAAGVVAATAGVGLLSIAPTQADEAGQAAGTWKLNKTGKVTATGKLVITATFNGVPGVKVTCNLKLDGTIPSPAPSAAPGGNITVSQKPPAVISSSDPASPVYKKCTDTYTGDADDVTASSALWSIVAKTPTATAPSPWAGSVTGSLKVPAGAITVKSPLVPNCTLNGPITAGTYAGTYNSGTGVVTATKNQNITVAKTGSCTIASPAKLTSASFKLGPIVDFVYTP